MTIDAIARRPLIEFPQQDETIFSPDYTVRISAPESVEAVDVSIDQGAWVPCRKAAGFWWHDWLDYADGEHEVIARIRGLEGRWLMSTPRKFVVQKTAIRPQ